MYHVGRPGHDRYLERVLHAWGIDGHNSHTNVCSAGARTGYAFWMGMDRPSPDHANAKFILLLSSHLETGHYFNPHAQRIIEAKMRGAKICVIDAAALEHRVDGRLLAAPWPGTEAALLLAIAQSSCASAATTASSCAVGELGGVPARGAARPAGDVRGLRARARGALRAVHARVRRAGERRRRGDDRRHRARDRPRRPARSPRTSGATPPRATSAAGRWRARSSCSSC